MDFEGYRAERPLPKSAGDDSGPATGSGISRRALLKYGSGTAMVAGVGLAGLLELLEHREAIAAGNVIPIVGVTREPDEAEETAHRHTFSLRFRVTSVSPSAIIGDVSGRTEAVISTGSFASNGMSVARANAPGPISPIRRLLPAAGAAWNVARTTGGGGSSG